MGPNQSIEIIPTVIRRFCSADGGIMAWVDMIQERTRGRLLAALRLAFYPAFGPVETKHFQALTMEAENALRSGDPAKSEKLCSTPRAVERTSSDSSHFIH